MVNKWLINTTIVITLAGLAASSIPYYATSFKLTILHTNDARAKYEQRKSFEEVCLPEDDRNGDCMFGVSRL